MFAELKDIPSKEEAIVGGIGGFIAASTITHGEIFAAVSAMIMRTLEFGMGIYQTNPLGESNISNLTVALASPGATLIYQKNGDSVIKRKERSRWEIIEDMLTVLVEDNKSKKTRIMQRAYLDWRNFRRYFDFLLEEGFIAKCNNPDADNYEITEKGRDLLKRLKVIDEILS